MKRSPDYIQINEKLSNYKPKPHITQNFYKNSNSEDFEDTEVPVRKFTPLPNIPRVDDNYYRTESHLIKNDIDDMSSDNNERPSGAITNNLKNKDVINLQKDVQQPELIQNINFDNKQIKWETKYHFSNSLKTHTTKRLPALDRHYNLHQAMDLDEDLPVNPINPSTHQRVAYTSPGERIISPLKRPSAPSPPKSSYYKYHENNSDSDNSL
jgi:hypothetical protein